jgi:predicted amidophosphoribosyltransferase
MDVKDIVTEYLTANGYDGLYNDDGECGCCLADLAPCGELCAECKAAYANECQTCAKSEDCEVRRSSYDVLHRDVKCWEGALNG